MTLLLLLLLRLLMCSSYMPHRISETFISHCIHLTFIWHCTESIRLLDRFLAHSGAQMKWSKSMSVLVLYLQSVLLTANIYPST
jgi:hypothetical protein